MSPPVAALTFVASSSSGGFLDSNSIPVSGTPLGMILSQGSKPRWQAIRELAQVGREIAFPMAISQLVKCLECPGFRCSPATSLLCGLGQSQPL